MLQVTIPETEFYDEEHEEFIVVRSQTIQMEHSLLSLSKWESKWQKPFLTDDPKSPDEMLDYYRCMTVTKNVPEYAYLCLPQKEIQRIMDYIQSKQTATTITHRKKPPPTFEVVTSELIYYWMVAANIPFECERWHLNRLLTLIQVYSAKNSKDEKMSRREVLEQNRAINAKRRAEAAARRKG